MTVRIRKGLDLPVAGTPEQTIATGAEVASVALIGDDYPGLKPRLCVEPGEHVRLGDTLFLDKRDPAVRFVAPGAGVVRAVNRGARRVLQSIIIDLDGDDQVVFEALGREAIGRLEADAVRERLLEAGLWTALRERPFDRVAPSDGAPCALFVTAIDSHPLAADPAVVIAAAAEAFADGLAVLRRLVTGPIYLCTADGAGIEAPALPDLSVEQFAGPHPAGLVGTHIHFLDPVRPGKSVWHIGYQDVIAIGRLFTGGRIPVERVVALGGPQVRSPRLLATRLGANTDDLLNDALQPGPARVVSGSLLNGRHAAGWARFLGRYHRAVAALPEPDGREFLGWLAPGLGKFSANRVYLSHMLPGRRFAMNTSQQGSPRAIVPVGHYERVMPLDLLATPLLKSLIVRDSATAISLGCLELAEEDLALCSLVCCSKQDFGAALRANLDHIAREF